MSIAKKYLFYSVLAFAVISLFFSCNTQDDIPGCTNTTSFNYNPAATVDDGSCVPVVNGCIYECSENYNPAANTDDGSCILERDKFIGVYDVETKCYGAIYSTTGDTIYSNSTISILADTSSCKILISAIPGYSGGKVLEVSGNDIIIPTVNYFNPPFIESHGGRGSIVGDTIFLLGAVISSGGDSIGRCKSIGVRQ